MTEREVRMRALECLSGMGVREATRLIRDAETLAEWVMKGADKDESPRVGRPAKTE